MNIYLDKDYYAKPDSELLGYVGELGARVVDITGLRVTGADSYSCIIEYENGTAVEVPIVDSYFTVSQELLPSAQRVRCQIVAKAHISGSETCYLVKKSNIFTAVIKPSLSADTPPGADTLLGSIHKAAAGIDAASPEAAALISGVIAEAIEKDISGG